MNLNFFLICFGILGCYAGLRTARSGWIKGLICILLAGCMIHFAFDTFMKPARPSPRMQIATREAIVRHPGFRGFLTDRMNDLEADRCVMRAMEVTPLSPVAHIVELRSFLVGYKQLQAEQLHGMEGLKNINEVAKKSLGETAETLSPKESAAIAAGQTGDLESLCNAFGKWTAKVALQPPAEQREMWNSFLSRIENQNE